VGPGQGDPGKRLRSGGRLSDDFDLGIALEQTPDALTHQLVVIKEEDSDTHAVILTVPLACVGKRRGIGGTLPAVPYTRVNDPEKLRRLMGAVLMITADVELADLLTHLVEEARALVGARYAALGVLNETRTGLERFITVGLTKVEEDDIGERPSGRGVLGLLITEPEPLRLEHLEEHPGRYGFPSGHPPMTSFLGVPLRVRDDVYGNLYLTDKEGATEFTDEDEALAEALAVAAGIAIENTRLHDRVRVMSVLDERDRIARDLHDRVIQRIYAVGMSLQGAARLPERNLVVERVSKAVDELDDTITQIRSTIFELGDSALPGGLRQAVVQLSDELAPTLGSRPDVRFEGAVDNSVPQHVGDHALAVVREGLTNAGKHAGASRYEVTLIVTDRLVLEIQDNGTGVELPLAQPGLGLVNIRERAEKLGGTFDLHPRDGGGTRLLWVVPL
jgi:signal transduction histidine kinase